jgi:myo-inositol 2-dehydrogenase/D-chiro-inositol 1-dehydrogenase
MGRIRAKILHSLGGAELAGIVDADFDSAAELAELYCGGGGGGGTLPPRLPVFGSVADAVRELGAGGGSGGAPSPLLGCVICTPTPTHGPLIREAARCGLSVFVEKPVAEDPDEVEELFGACESAGVRLCCGFQRRFDPSYAACRDAVASGRIGEPRYAHLFFADHPVPPREYLLGSGGDIFVDLLAHDVDFALDALGDEVADVRAVASSSDPDLGAAGVRDTASALLTTRKGAPLPLILVAIRCLLPCPHFVSHFPGGSRVPVCLPKRTRAIAPPGPPGASIAVFLSRGAAYGYDQRCEVFGTRGLARVGSHPEHSAAVRASDGTRGPRLVHSFPQRFRRAFELEMEAFVGLLLRDESSAGASDAGAAVASDDSDEDDGGGGGPTCWPVTRSQCVHVQRVVRAAILSAQIGQVVPVGGT